MTASNTLHTSAGTVSADQSDEQIIEVLTRLTWRSPSLFLPEGEELGDLRRAVFDGRTTLPGRNHQQSRTIVNKALERLGELDALVRKFQAQDRLGRAGKWFGILIVAAVFALSAPLLMYFIGDSSASSTLGGGSTAGLVDFLGVFWAVAQAVLGVAAIVILGYGLIGGVVPLLASRTKRH